MDSTYTDNVSYGAHCIDFKVVRTNRTTLGINVHPDGSVVVRAPHDASEEKIRSKVKRRSRWILRHQQRFSTLIQPSQPKEYVSGETHRYLGRQYRLKILSADADKPEGVWLRGRYFQIQSHNPSDRSRTKQLLERWYRAKAGFHIRKHFEAGCAVMRRYGVSPPELRIQTMTHRWGSCTSTGRILLNPKLIQAPSGCIEYVVLHELCHLIEPHHGPPFYQLLDRVMPDWPHWKGRLEQVQ